MSIRQGLLGLAIGVAGGILAGVVLAPKRNPLSNGSAPGEGGGFGGDFLPRFSGGRGLLPDEQITERLRSELLRQGTSSRVDVTTVDGVVYLRGKESDPVKADEAVAAAYAISGVRDVIDEIRRET